MLAEGYISVSDYPSAIEVLSKLLEKTPNNRYIKTRLEWLQGQ